MPQDAAFTHLKPVCASPQPGAKHHLLRLSVSREGDGVLRATTEFIARDKNLSHFVSEGRNHRCAADARAARAGVVRRTLKSVTHRKQELKFQEINELNLKTYLFIFMI